jgi:hypothetical protein
LGHESKYPLYPKHTCIHAFNHARSLLSGASYRVCTSRTLYKHQSADDNISSARRRLRHMQRPTERVERTTKTMLTCKHISIGLGVGVNLRSKHCIFSHKQRVSASRAASFGYAPRLCERFELQLVSAIATYFDWSIKYFYAIDWFLEKEANRPEGGAQGGCPRRRCTCTCGSFGFELGKSSRRDYSVLCACEYGWW